MTWFCRIFASLFFFFFFFFFFLTQAFSFIYQMVGVEKLDEWVALVKQCKYLPEQDLKRLCEHVKEFLFSLSCFLAC
jgi:hypothetical protein